MRKLVLIGAVVLVSGCGGDSKSSTSTTAATTTSTSAATTASSTLTHAQFVHQLDTLCAEGNKTFTAKDKEIQSALNANDAARAGAIINSEVSTMNGFLSQIEKLTPPGADQPAFARYVLLTRRIIGLEQRVASALEANNIDEANRLGNLLTAAQGPRTNAAVDLGTTHCGT
ncbi:MAG TPA: hypothetical protein VLK36_05185 [Gaiellaceae bacterium]|nr:hypothetical protein [Gaiellaceae bacterium]